MLSQLIAGSLWPAEMSGICSALTVCTPLSQLDVSLYRGCGAARAINTCQPCEWLCSHIIRANTSLTEAEDEDVRQENTHKQSLYGLVTVSGSCLLMSWIFLNSVEQTVQYVDSQIKEWETEHLNILKIIYHGLMHVTTLWHLLRFALCCGTRHSWRY